MPTALRYRSPEGWMSEKVDDAVGAVLGKIAMTLLAAITIAFMGWVGVSINEHGRTLGEVKTSVDLTRSDVSDVKTVVKGNRDDIERQLGQLVNVQAQERSETAQLKQALADHEVEDAARVAPAGARPRGN